MNPLAIKLKDVRQTFGDKEVLSIPESTIYQNERIGIIGGNGQGKSTLLKIIHGDLIPDEGKVQREIAFSYYAQISDLVEANNNASFDWSLLSRFGVPDHAVPSLSGGEAAKYRLTQVISNYQLGLLLDEPTTHLDRDSIEKLITELNFYYGTIVFVSHDRQFLNALATKIWEVSDGSVTEYSGNYDEYLKQKELKNMTAAKEAENYMKERSRLEKAVKQKQMQAEKMQKVSAKKMQKNIRPDRLSSSKQKDTSQKGIQKQAKSIQSRLDQLEEKTVAHKKKKIVFPETKTIEMHNKFPIRAENFTLKKGEKRLLDNCDFSFELGKKIALIGRNGVGKTSLLEAIVNDSDGIILSSKVVFSIYRQMDYKMDTDTSVIVYLMQHTMYSEPLIRSILNNLGFEQSELSKSVCHLSGGETTKIQIAMLFTVPSNVLILDEPTNFIDLETIQALEELMQQYRGTILFTSHDPYFVKNTANQIYQIADCRLKKVETYM